MGDPELVGGLISSRFLRLRRIVSHVPGRPPGDVNDRFEIRHRFRGQIGLVDFAGDQ